MERSSASVIYKCSPSLMRLRSSHSVAQGGISLLMLITSVQGSVLAARNYKI
jgi:hypothetical protein